MANLVDRIVSAVSYFTFGLFGVIWLIFVNVAKKPLSKFALFNIFQSVFVSIIFVVIGMAFDLLLKIGHFIGFIDNILRSFNLFFNGTPIYFGYSISGLIVMAIITYMVVFSLFGKKPFVPVVTPIIEMNTGA